MRAYIQKSIDINFGLCRDSFEKQLQQQGFQMKCDVDADTLDNIDDAISWLHINGMITDCEKNKILKKILKFIVNNAEQIETEEGLKNE